MKNQQESTTPPSVVLVRRPRRGDAAVADNADLFDYALIRDWAGFVLGAPRRHKLLSLACFLAVVGLALGAAKVLPKRYQAQGRILAQRNPVMWTLSNPSLARPTDWDAPTRAARETVLRRDNLIALSKQTDFVERYLRTRAPIVLWRDQLVERISGKTKTPAERLDELVDTLERRLWVEVGSEGTVTVTFEWSDRDIAYQMVEAALQNFLEVRHASEISIVGEAISILENHASKLQRQIDGAMDALEAKERMLRRAAPPKHAPVVRARPRESEDVARMRIMLAAKHRAIADLEEFRQRRLAELQAQLSQQLTTYADQHPAVQTTRQNIEQISAPSPQIQALRNEAVDLEHEIVRRGGQVSESPRDLPQAAGLDELASSRLAVAPAEDEDPRLEYERGQVRLLVRQYSNLLDRIDAARMEMDTVQAAFKYRYSVITPPQMPKKPLRPNAMMLAIAGVLGGILLTLFAAAAVDLRSGRVVERWQIERELDLPILADLR